MLDAIVYLLTLPELGYVIAVPEASRVYLFNCSSSQSQRTHTVWSGLVASGVFLIQYVTIRRRPVKRTGHSAAGQSLKQVTD